jgi:Di-haem cytochrome c peroxidase/Ferritin-like domain
VRNLSGALNILLADVFALYLKTKNFHWHTSGPHFRDYHLLLDEQGDIAERVKNTGWLNYNRREPLRAFVHSTLLCPESKEMHPTLLAVLLLLSHSYAVLAAPAASEDTGVGSPPALAPGQAPPLPKLGPLAEPRSKDQVGLPTVLTKWVISPPSSRMPARAALGQKLFFDGRLSANGTVACATRHNPARAFTEGRPTSTGIHGRVGQRNAPTVLNALYNKHQFWDGRVNTLEQQAALPIANPIEMGSASSPGCHRRSLGHAAR